MVDSTLFSKLTERQRVVLRLHHHHLIKEVADHLGISVSAVNQSLTQCRNILGAPSSRVAAKWFAAHEQGADTYRESAYQLSTVSPNPSMPTDEGLDAMGADDGAEGNDRTHEVHPASLPDGPEPREFLTPWPVKTRRVPQNQLRAATRIALVVAVAALLVAAAILVALLSVDFQDALVSLQHLFVRH